VRRLLGSRTALVLLALLAVALVAPPAAGSAGRPPRGPDRPGEDTPPVVVYITDGLRQDLTRRYAREGRLPAFADVLRGASTREGLVPPPIPNSAPGWTTLLTGASVAESGIVSNTYFDATRPFGTGALSGFSPDQVQAETIFASAQRQGLDVMSLGVVGFSDAWLEVDGRDNVAVEYYPDWLGARGIVANYDVPLPNTDLLSLNDYLTSASVTFTPADGWTQPPRSHSPQMESTFQTAGITFHLLVSDTTDNGVTDYDDVLVAPSEDAGQALTRLGAGEWSPSLDVTTPAGLAGGVYLKVLDLAPDLSRFRMYHTPVTRIRAHPAAAPSSRPPARP
jgi:hypothetical protein